MIPFRWGVFGVSGISAKFAAGLTHARDARLAMVALRDQAKAAAFARTFGAERPVEGYEAAAKAGGIDAVYIATPPAQHLAHALACIEAGLPVLIEKPFAADAEDARRIADAARSAGVFCMEGMWTRFVPAAQHLKALLEAGAIGEPRQVIGGLGSSNAVEPGRNNFDPAAGGGALSYLGVYPISLGQWLMGAPATVVATGRIGETGVDEDAAVTVQYASGVTGAFQASLRAPLDDFRVIGTQGQLAFHGPVFRPYGVDRTAVQPRARPTGLGLGRTALLREHGVAQRLSQVFGGLRGSQRTAVRHYAGNGYHYEADEVARCIAAGLTESPVMPLADSIAVAETIDRARAAIRGKA